MVHLTPKCRFSLLFSLDHVDLWPISSGSIFHEGWRRLLWLRLIWDILQATRPVNEEMSGYAAGLQNTDCRSFYPLRDLDLWPLVHFSEEWRKLLWLQLIWDLLQTNRPVNKKWESTQGPKMLIFLCFFRSLTLNNELWVTFSEQWLKLLWLQIIWDFSQSNRPVNEEMGGYTT